MSITKRNASSFCRTCLTKLEKSGANKINIYETQDLSNWIHICTSVDVVKSDGYPKFLCQPCYGKIQSLYEFRTMSIRSMRILDGIIQGTTQNTTKPNPEVLEKFIDAMEKCEPGQLTNHLYQDIQWLHFNNKLEIPDIQEDCDDDKDLVSTMLAETVLDDSQRELAQADHSPEMKIDVDATAKLELHVDDVNGDADSEDDDSKDEDFQQAESDDSEEDADDDSDDRDFSMTLKTKSKGVKRRERSKRKTTACSSGDAAEKERATPPKGKSQVLKCEKCPKRCFNQVNFDAHMRTHEGLKPYPCLQCHRSYNKTSHLNAHIKDSHAEHTQEFLCEFEGCGKKFRRVQSYRVHYRIKHAEDKPIPKIYVCEDCGRTFKNITTLKEHRYKHTNEEDYPYQCEHCLKRYVSQRTYREHLMRHAGIKNFVCTYCGMKKTTKSELRIHINYHTKEKQWPCPLCPSVFNSSANLGLHDRVVHKGIRRYTCRFCEQSFGKAETLKHHEMRHTGEKPHECEICGKRFIQVVALRAHLKTHKNIKVKNDEKTKPNTAKAATTSN